MKLKPPGIRRLLAVSSCVVATAHAQNSIDEIIIVGESQLVESQVSLEGDALRVPNVGDFLRAVPGANLNRNGPLTALPQYRGTSGDRINVSVDGMPLIPGGPNAMDAPLSSVPGANLKTLSVSRGIASVSAGQETLGGHMSIESRQGEFGDGDDFVAELRANSLYQSNGSGLHASVLAYAANRAHKIGLSHSYQDGDNQEFPGGELPSSFFRRDSSGLFYGWQTDQGGLHIDYGRSDTQDTGTAALPMDILFIDSESAHVAGHRYWGDWMLELSLGRREVEHGMSNDEHRPAPSMNMGGMSMPMRRYSFAAGEHDHAKLSLEGPLILGARELGTVKVGSDYSQAWHDTEISDPGNAAFFLDNFNEVEKQITGLFAEWVYVGGPLSWELGLRQNQWQSDAEQVRAAGAAPMMAANVMPLASAFNNADRSRDENNTDLVAKLAYDLSDHATASLGLARKTRAPSYQELYLWVPLSSTGGLADGRNYMGRLGLDSEVAREINLGMDLYRDTLTLSMQLFYREVDDYIQGTSDIDSPYVAEIQMVSTMMSGQPALQFNNVDAELYGADLGCHGEFGGRYYYRGNLSYVRGKRVDVADNLYRIAPLNHSLTIGGHFGDWDLSATSELAAEQDKVASYNNEQRTPGYGLLHVNARWHPSPQLRLMFGVDNLLDKDYELHLNGYNRVANADVALGARLPGPGRNVRVGVSYEF